MIKHIKKYILILVAFVIAIAPLCAFGDEIALNLFATKGTDSVELLQEGSFDESIVKSADFVENDLGKMSDQGSTRATTVDEYIYRQLKYVNEEINLGSLGYNLTMDELKKVYTNVINDHPDLFYVSSSYSYISYDDKYAYYVYPNYVMDSSAVSKAKVIFENGVQRALNQVNDSMNTEQKLLTLHDYFCNIATYPGDFENNDKQIYHSAYGIFYNGYTVCAGYTLAFTYVLQRLGIESEYVVSTDMAHAWNKVKVDGNWYNIDLTYDDNSLYSDRKNVYGSMFHRCFLKSDSFMATADGYYHHGGQTYDNCAANSTLYDDSTFNDVSTNIYYVDGAYYSLDFDPGTSNLYLFCTKNGITSKIGGKIEYNSDNFTTGHKVPGKLFTQTAKSLDVHSRLVYLDGIFYVSVKNYIYAYMPVDNGWSRQVFVDESGQDIFGLGVDFDGNLIYQKKSDFVVHTQNKMNYFNDYITKDKNGPYHFYPDVNKDGVINAKDYAKIINDLS